jgi:hypothetical protein
MKYRILFVVVVLASIYTPAVREPVLQKVRSIPVPTFVQSTLFPWADSARGLQYASDQIRGVRRERTISKSASDADSQAVVHSGDSVKVRLLISAMSPAREVKFDSRRRGQGGFEFTVGDGEVIPGVEEAVLGMKKGERALFVVGADKAYGPRGFTPWSIEPNEPLYFDVEVVEVSSPSSKGLN